MPFPSGGRSVGRSTPCPSLPCQAARQGNPLPYPLRSQPLPLALRHPYPLRLVQRQPLTPASPLPRLIYFPLYSVTPCPLFKCPMQHLKDALTAAALTFLAWLMAVAFLSL